MRFVEEYQGKGDEGVLDELMDGSFVNHSPAPGLPADKEGVRMLFATLRGAMPDLRVDVHDMIAEGDIVATRKTFYGTQTGELFGQPPTNKEIAISVFDFVRIKGGKIVEHWNLVDNYGMMLQLGAIAG